MKLTCPWRSIGEFPRLVAFKFFDWLVNTAVGFRDMRKQLPLNKRRKPRPYTFRSPLVEPLEARQLLSVTWNGGAGYNWSTGGNWSSGTAPSGGDLVFAGSYTTSNNNLTGTAFNSITFSSSGFALSGNSVALTSGVTVDSGVSNATINFNIALSGSNTFNVASGATLTVSGALSGSGSLSENGGGSLTLSGSNFNSGGVILSAGTLNLDGSSSMTGAISTTGGTLAPGYDTAGTVTASALTLGASSEFEVNITGNSAGTGYSQIQTTGSVALGSGGYGPSLVVNDTRSSGTADDSAIVLIENGSGSAVSGTFSGLPEGSPVVLSSGIYLITYKYNPSSPTVLDGNDVALIKPAAFIPDQSAPGPTTDGNLVLSADAGSSVTLNYNSSAATGTTVLTGDAVIASTYGGSSLSDVKVSASMGGYTSSTIDYGDSVFGGGSVSSSGPYQFAVPFTESSLASGRYRYTMTISEYYGGSSTAGQTITIVGYKDFLNLSGSPDGAGWNVDGFDTLVASSEYGPSGISLIKSDGSMDFFWPSGDSTYVSENGPFAFDTLTGDSEDGYTLTGVKGVKETFLGSGKLNQVIDNDGNVTQYSYIPSGTYAGLLYQVSSLGQTTTFAYSSGEVQITDFDGRTTTLSLTSTQLAAIDDADPNNSFVSGEATPATNFTYSSSRLATMEDPNGNSTHYYYATGSGRLTYIEYADSSSTYQYQSAFTLPIDNGAYLTPVSAVAATTTDESSNVASETLNRFGDPIDVTNALSATTSYTRDDNSLVTEMVQPAVDNGGTMDNPTTYYTYDAYGSIASEEAPDGSTQTWTNTLETATYGGPDDVVTEYANGLGHKTLYSVSASTGDSLSSEQYANGTSANDLGQNTAADGGDPINSFVYTTGSGWNASAPLGSVASTTDPDGYVSAYTYDAAGNETTEYKGQTVAVSSDAASFNNLPQSPGLPRTYEIYVETSSSPSSGYSVSDTAGSLTLSGSVSSTTPLGTGWYFLGSVATSSGDVSGTVTVSCPSGVTAVTLLEQTSATVYNTAEDPVSVRDGLNNVQATNYDNLDRPVATFQGQTVALTSGSSVFSNLPQSPGLARNYTVYVQATSEPTSLTGYSITDSSGSPTVSLAASTSTPLGSGWYQLASVSLTSSDTSGTITVSHSGSGVTAFTLLEQTGTTVYDAASNDVSDTDGLGRISVNVYNTLEQPTQTWQGQVLPTSSASATFTNLPLTPYDDSGAATGAARLFEVYVLSASTPSDSSFHVSDNLSGSITTSFSESPTTSLGYQWYSLGTVTISASDASSSLTFTSLGSSDSQICLVQEMASQTYTPTGLVATETNGDNQTTTLAYDAAGEETSQTDPAPDSAYSSVQPVTAYVHSAIGQVTATVDPLGNTTAYVYGFGSDEDTTTTYTGRTVAMSGGSASFTNMLQSPTASRVYYVFAESSSTLTSASGFSVSDTASDSLSISGTFSVVTPLGANWYQLGTVTLTSGETSPTLTVSHSGSGISAVALLLQSQVDTYNAAQNLTSQQDALGNSTTFTYSPLGLPSQQPDPSDPSIELGPLFGKNRNTVSDTNLATGATTDYTFDMLGDIVKTTPPSVGGETGGTSSIYDIDGQLIQQSNALGDVSSFSYDSLGDQVTSSEPNPTTGAAGGPTLTSQFDLDQEMVSQTTPLYETTNWSFDSFGNKVSEVLPPQILGGSSPTTSYTFDATHLTLTQTDADNNVTSWQYNNDGQSINESITVPGSGGGSTTETEYFGRDLDGNETSLVDFDLRVTTYSYNSLNQEASEAWYASGGSSESNAITYTYDVLGQMIGGVDSYADPGFGGSGGFSGIDTSDTLAYNNVGQVVGEAQAISGRETVVIAQGWNADNTRASLSAVIGGTLASDGSVSGGTLDLENIYTYDARQRMIGIEQTGAFSGGATPKFAALGYDDANQVTTIDTYNAGDADSENQVMDLAVTYDHASRPASLTYTSSSGILAAYAYGYDSDNNVQVLFSYNDTSDTGSLTSSVTTWARADYNYTGDEQLSIGGSGGSGGYSVVYTNWANAPTTDNSITYDYNGNRNSSGATVSAGNQVTFDGTYYYQFDAEGNRIAKFKSDTGALDDTATDITTYTWDNRNRMTSLMHQDSYGGDPDLLIEYGYDVFNRMVEESSGGLDHRMIYDGSNVLESLNSDDSAAQRFLNGPAVDEVLAEEVTGGDAPGVNWLLADAQGTVRDVVRTASSGGSGGNGYLVDHVILDAYGNQTSPQSASDSDYLSPIGFQGMMIDPLAGFSFVSDGMGGYTLDSASGLYYTVNSGWYDGSTGAFVTAAQQGYNPGVMNPFEFSGDNPATTNLSMQKPPTNPSGAVGIVDSGGGDATPVRGALKTWVARNHTVSSNPWDPNDTRTDGLLSNNPWDPNDTRTDGAPVSSEDVPSKWSGPLIGSLGLAEYGHRDWHDDAWERRGVVIHTVGDFFYYLLQELPGSPPNNGHNYDAFGPIPGAPGNPSFSRHIGHCF
jgi:YD repeat-containing protein